MLQKSPEESIRAANAQLVQTLPFDDIADLDDAARGYIGTLDDPEIRDAEGNVVWDASTYDFLSGDAPDSVNPSLWRQSKLVAKHGLFEVVEGIYQVRGLDLANVTFIEGDAGVLVLDPLVTEETAAAALALFRKHRGDRPVTAVLYTHPHVDHFGGVRGVTTQDDVDSGRVPIIAPAGFTEHAASENVYAGTAMARRSAYMFGAALARGTHGAVGAGLGQTVSTGNITLIAPTLDITRTGQEETIDGVRMVFQMAPESEAPAEFLVYLPDHKALCTAEDATHTLHNLLTLRGALVRNPHAWTHYLTEAIDLFGEDLEVVFASHHWPIWGQERVIKFISEQRDLYAYLHDQTLRLINKGYTGIEIAETLPLPPALENAWHTHGYYGSVSHNIKAIYQRYMGWFDGNPAHLWQHPPVEQGKRYVQLAGGTDAMLASARASFESADYRWAAEITSHLVFAEPDNQAARDLLADTLEQLGYGAENGIWRNFYLSGATELRDGKFGTPTVSASADVISALTPEMLFDAIAIQIDGPRAWHEKLSIDVVLTDVGVRYRLWLSNGALSYSAAAQHGTADATLAATKASLPALAAGAVTADGLAGAGVEITGDASVIERLAALLDPGDKDFSIVTP